MADFGPQASQVSAPQAAGANPVAPVTQDITPPNWGQALAGLGQAVGGIAGGIVKKQQLDADQTFLKDIAQKQALINQGVEQGTFGTSEADTRTRTIYNQALAARPDLADKIGSLSGVFQKTTVSGDIEQARADANSRRTTDLNSAAANGYYISPNATTQQKDAIIQANQAGVTMQRELTAQYKKNDEDRASGRYNRDLADAQLKDTTVRLSADFADKNMQAADAQIQDLVKRFTSGDLVGNPQAAQAEMARIRAHYDSGLTAIGNQNPALVAGWKDSFKNLFDAGDKALDPKTEAGYYENQASILLNKAKIKVLTSNPQIAPIVATSQLLGPNNGATRLFSTGAAYEALAGAISTPVVNGASSGGFKPAIVGNPAAEAPTLDFLKTSIKSINSGGFTDPVKAKIEAANGVNNVLVETGKALDGGAKAEDLKGLVGFFASPEYASWVKTGQVDPIAQQTAAKTFQIVYQPAVTKGVSNALSGKDLIPASEDGTQTSVSMAQGLDVKMVNGVLTFMPYSGLKLTPEQQNAAQSSIKNLQTPQTALNTMVRLGAHMEGSTDYEAHWEKNKYYYLPQVFPVKPGQVAGNLKWSGNGDWRDKSTWSRVGQR